MKLCIFGIILMIVIVCAGWSDELYGPLKFGVHGSASLFKSALNYGESVQPESYSLGVTFHVVPMLAIRPGVVFLKTENKYQNKFTSGPEYKNGEGLAIGALCDVHLFVNLAEHLAFFGGPGIVFTSSTSQGFSSTGVKSSEYKNVNILVPVKFGAQYLFNRNFGFYSDMALEFMLYSRTSEFWNGTTGVKNGETKDSSLYMYFRPPILGAIFYVN